MIGTGQDITERRRVEDERDQLLADERRAGAFREAFVDVISHELRTPITTILGLTQILTRPGRVDDEASRTALLEDVRAESERLHRLVEDLLVMSRMERGILVAEAEPLELRRLLERIVAHESAELPSIRIELQLEPGLPIVAGEDTYVEQIVRNILGNAAKYTPAETRVVVDARREGRAVAIRFLDDGPGIPEASIPHLFELFYRDPQSARTVAGSGIGLFVCTSLVEAMGGRYVGGAPTGGRHGVRVHDARARGRRAGPGRRRRAVDRTPGCAARPPSPQSASGSIFSGSIPSSRMALAAFDAGSAPQRARATIVAAAMCAGSISKRARRSSRVSLRPKPSVPERDVVRRQPARDEVGHRLHPVARGDDRPAVERQDRR